ncbi:MAG: hypothetical protein MZV49_27145 [Rhodopseudomonas palustris]|nr:hypothetical protein [Rhodopseudomonas palustris]
MRSSAGHRLSPLRPSPHITARQLAGPPGMVVMRSPPAIAELSRTLHGIQEKEAPPLASGHHL